jgi:hypothetical protein
LLTAARFLACAEDFRFSLFLNAVEDETTALGAAFHPFLETANLELRGRSIAMLLVSATIIATFHFALGHFLERLCLPTVRANILLPE